MQNYEQQRMSIIFTWDGRMMRLLQNIRTQGPLGVLLVADMMKENAQGPMCILFTRRHTEDGGSQTEKSTVISFKSWREIHANQKREKDNRQRTQRTSENYSYTTFGFSAVATSVKGSERPEQFLPAIADPA
jgi:hypothetical protein